VTGSVMIAGGAGAETLKQSARAGPWRASGREGSHSLGPADRPNGCSRMRSRQCPRGPRPARKSRPQGRTGLQRAPRDRWSPPVQGDSIR